MRLLLVDDASESIMIYVDNLNERFQLEEGFGPVEILHASTMSEAKELIKNRGHEIDVAVLDMNMTAGGGSETGGLDLLKYINEQRFDIKSLIWTAFASPKNYIECQLNNLFAYVEKSESLDDLFSLIKRAYEEKAGKRFECDPPIYFMKGLGIKQGDCHLSYVTDITLPRYTKDMVVAKTLRLGVCGTDVPVITKIKDKPVSRHLVEFHEVVGEVVATGAFVPKDQFQAGDWVIPMVRRCHNEDRVNDSSWDLKVKRCKYSATCRHYHRPDTCLENPDGYLSRGTGKYHGFGTEYFSDYADCLVKVTPSQKAKLGRLCVLTEPLSVAWKMIRQIQENRRIKPGDRILVAGIGPIGIFCLAILKWMCPGIKLFAVDLVDEQHYKVKILKKYNKEIKYGETEKSKITIKNNIVELNKAAWPKFDEEQEGKDKFDIVIDATGDTADVLPKALQSVKPEGLLGLLSVMDESSIKILNFEEKDLNKVIRQEIKIIGSVCASKQDMEESLWFMETLCSKEFLEAMIYPQTLKMAAAVDKLRDLNRTEDYLKITIEP